MDYKNKIIKAISLSKNFNDITYIEEKIRTTSQINRRTLDGRKLTDELLNLTQQRKSELVESGEQPF